MAHIIMRQSNAVFVRNVKTITFLISNVKRRNNVKGIHAGAGALLLAPCGRPHRLSHEYYNKCPVQVKRGQ